MVVDADGKHALDAREKLRRVLAERQGFGQPVHVGMASLF
jgi:hypothetical protein